MLAARAAATRLRYSSFAIYHKNVAMMGKSLFSLPDQARFFARSSSSFESFRPQSFASNPFAGFEPSDFDAQWKHHCHSSSQDGVLVTDVQAVLQYLNELASQGRGPFATKLLDSCIQNYFSSPHRKPISTESTRALYLSAMLIPKQCGHVGRMGADVFQTVLRVKQQFVEFGELTLDSNMHLPLFEMCLMFSLPQQADRLFLEMVEKKVDLTAPIYECLMLSFSKSEFFVPRVLSLLQQLLTTGSNSALLIKPGTWSSCLESLSKSSQHAAQALLFDDLLTSSGIWSSCQQHHQLTSSSISILESTRYECLLRACLATNDFARAENLLKPHLSHIHQHDDREKNPSVSLLTPLTLMTRVYFAQIDAKSGKPLSLVLERALTIARLSSSSPSSHFTANPALDSMSLESELYAALLPIYQSRKDSDAVTQLAPFSQPTKEWDNTKWAKACISDFIHQRDYESLFRLFRGELVNAPSSMTSLSTSASSSLLTSSSSFPDLQNENDDTDLKDPFDVHAKDVKSHFNIAQLRHGHLQNLYMHAAELLISQGAYIPLVTLLETLDRGVDRNFVVMTNLYLRRQLGVKIRAFHNRDTPFRLPNDKTMLSLLYSQKDYKSKFAPSSSSSSISSTSNFRQQYVSPATTLSFVFSSSQALSSANRKVPSQESGEHSVRIQDPTNLQQFQDMAPAEELATLLRLPDDQYTVQSRARADALLRQLWLVDCVLWGDVDGADALLCALAAYCPPRFLHPQPQQRQQPDRTSCHPDENPSNTASMLPRLTPLSSVALATTLDAFHCPHTVRAQQSTKSGLSVEAGSLRLLHRMMVVYSQLACQDGSASSSAASSSLTSSSSFEQEVSPTPPSFTSFEPSTEVNSFSSSSPITQSSSMFSSSEIAANSSTSSASPSSTSVQLFPFDSASLNSIRPPMHWRIASQTSDFSPFPDHALSASSSSSPHLDLLSSLPSSALARQLPPEYWHALPLASLGMLLPMMVTAFNFMRASVTKSDHLSQSRRAVSACLFRCVESELNKVMGLDMEAPSTSSPDSLKLQILQPLSSELKSFAIQSLSSAPFKFFPSIASHSSTSSSLSQNDAQLVSNIIELSHSSLAHPITPELQPSLPPVQLARLRAMMRHSKNDLYNSYLFLLLDSLSEKSPSSSSSSSHINSHESESTSPEISAQPVMYTDEDLSSSSVESSPVLSEGLLSVIGLFQHMLNTGVPPADSAALFVLRSCWNTASSSSASAIANESSSSSASPSITVAVELAEVLAAKLLQAEWMDSRRVIQVMWTNAVRVGHAPTALKYALKAQQLGLCNDASFLKVLGRDLSMSQNLHLILQCLVVVFDSSPQDASSSSQLSSDQLLNQLLKSPQFHKAQSVFHSCILGAIRNLNLGLVTQFWPQLEFLRIPLTNTQLLNMLTSDSASSFPLLTRQIIQNLRRRYQKVLSVHSHAALSMFEYSANLKLFDQLRYLAQAIHLSTSERKKFEDESYAMLDQASQAYSSACDAIFGRQALPEKAELAKIRLFPSSVSANLMAKLRMLHNVSEFSSLLISPHHHAVLSVIFPDNNDSEFLGKTIGSVPFVVGVPDPTPLCDAYIQIGNLEMARQRISDLKRLIAKIGWQRSSEIGKFVYLLTMAKRPSATLEFLKSLLESPQQPLLASHFRTALLACVVSDQRELASNIMKLVSSQRIPVDVNDLQARSRQLLQLKASPQSNSSISASTDLNSHSALDSQLMVEMLKVINIPIPKSPPSDAAINSTTDVVRVGASRNDLKPLTW